MRPDLCLQSVGQWQMLPGAEETPDGMALLALAGKVQLGGKNVTPADVERARKQGATELEIHDTVLIAAAFCMYNRYVDGLGTWAPNDADLYRQMGAGMADEGYIKEDPPPARAAASAK
jgi:hypothetical protein